MTEDAKENVREANVLSEDKYENISYFDLIRKIDNKIEELEINQPYIKTDNLVLYFKIFSSELDIDVKQLDNDCFKIIYSSYDKKNIGDYVNLDDNVTKYIDSLNTYLDEIVENSIKKEFTFNFKLDYNENFFDDSDFKLNYINNILKDEYSEFNIMEANDYNNDISKLYMYCLSNGDKKIYKYFLFVNSICIKFNLDIYCNDIMSDIIKNMLLSCSFDEELSKKDISLDVSKDELDKAFEIVEI